jgi:hypothetical protein
MYVSIFLQKKYVLESNIQYLAVHVVNEYTRLKYSSIKLMLQASTRHILFSSTDENKSLELRQKSTKFTSAAD